MDTTSEESVRKAALLKRLSLVDDSILLDELERVLDEFGASQLQPLDEAAVRAIVEELLGGD